MPAIATTNDWEHPDTATTGFIVPPGDGDDVPTKPGSKRKASSGNTGGRFLVDEAFLAPGEVVPPHRHANLAEIFYVLEGEIRLQIGDRIRTVGRGAFAFSPVGSAHAFSTVGASPARMLIVAVPQDPNGQTLETVERYFAALAELPPPADRTAADLAAWNELGRIAGIERA